MSKKHIRTWKEYWVLDIVGQIMPFFLFSFQHRNTQSSSNVTVKKLDKSHLCEHKIQILCQRVKITLGSKKQQLSQPFHAEMNINLGSKEELEKKMHSANLNQNCTLGNSILNGGTD